MFGEIEGMAQRLAAGQLDQQAVGQAARDGINAMDHREFSDHLQGAADTAAQNGQPAVAAQIAELLAQHGSNPQELKAAAISLIENNPQVLQHFAPPFLKNVLGAL